MVSHFCKQCFQLGHPQTNQSYPPTQTSSICSSKGLFCHRSTLVWCDVKAMVCCSCSVSLLPLSFLLSHCNIFLPHTPSSLPSFVSHSPLSPHPLPLSPPPLSLSLSLYLSPSLSSSLFLFFSLYISYVLSYVGVYQLYYVQNSFTYINNYLSKRCSLS